MEPWDFVMLMRCVLLGVFQESSPELEQLGLQPKTFTLLASIPRFPFPAELAKHLFVPPPTITFMIKQLERLGYVVRQGDAADLRRYHLTVTDKGEEAVAKGREIIGEAMNKRMRNLTRTQQMELEMFLRSLQGGVA